MKPTVTRSPKEFQLFYSMWPWGSQVAIPNVIERGRHQEPPAEPMPEAPALETLMPWADEGGCEAACPHQCWIEPDAGTQSRPP